MAAVARRRPRERSRGAARVIDGPTGVRPAARRGVQSSPRAAAIGLGVSMLFFLPVAAALSARVPDIVETPITVSEPASLIPQFTSVPLELSPLPASAKAAVRSARLSLSVLDPSRLLRSNAVELLVTRYFTDPRIVQAELLVPAAGCAYRSPDDLDEFPNNALLLLRRRGECRSTPGPLQLEFVVTYEGVGRFAVWAYEPRAGADRADAIVAAGPAYPAGSPAPALHGYYADDRGLSRFRRVDLLSFLWLGRIDARDVWRDVIVAWLALAAGIALIVVSGGRARPAVGTALVAGAIALCYQVIVPPFQAPDEPTHLWGYGALTGDSGATGAEIQEIAKVTHFTRLRFWRFERFRPSDTSRASEVGWLDTSIQEGHRSGTFPKLASLVHAAAPTASGTRALRLWRRTAVAALAMAFLIAALVFGNARPGVLSLLIVPALPFLTVALSNYSLLNAAFVVVAAGIVALAVDGRRVVQGGLAVGLGCAVALASARSAAAFAPLLVASAVAHALERGDGHADRRDWTWWAGLAAGIPLFVILSAGPYFSYLAELAHARVSAAYGVVALGFFVLTGLAFLDRRRPAVGRLPGAPAAMTVRAACWIAAAVILIGLLGSAIVTLPTLPFLATGAPTAPGAYVLKVLESATFPFRFTQHDYMLSTTFWGSFGWMNLPLPDVVLGTLSGLTGLALAAQLVFCARRGSTRDCVWAIAIVAGTLATLLLCAALAVVAQADVHGRYIMGIYLPIVLFAFSGPAFRVWPGAVGWGVCGIALAAHAYALTFLVVRYF